MDSRAWWATVHRVASSQTELGGLTLSLLTCHLLVSQLPNKILPLSHHLVSDLLACHAVSIAILDSVTNALQYGVVFCCTMTQISHKSTYIPILSLPLTPTSIPPLWVLTDHLAELLVLCSKLPTAYLFYIWWWMYFGTTLSICPTLSFSHCAHKFILYICISILSLKIGSSASFS